MASDWPPTDWPPTENELKPGTLVLFHGRVATVTHSSRNGRMVWHVEVTDDGGRTRSFQPIRQSDITRFPSILDAVAAAGAQPTDDLEVRARRAERWFTSPQIGDVFSSFDSLHFVEITWRFGALVQARIRLSSSIDRERQVAWRTSIRGFPTVEAFQREYQIQHEPGYTVFAWSSNRPDGQDRIEIPCARGEAK